MTDSEVFLILAGLFFLFLIINYIRVKSRFVREVNDWTKKASDSELISHIRSAQGGATMNSWTAEKHNTELSKAMKELRRRGYKK